MSRFKLVQKTRIPFDVTKDPAKELLRNSGAYAAALLTLVVDQFGTECFDWSPATLKMELEEAFAIEIPKSNFDKLMAAITLITTDLFYHDVTRFIQLTNSLADADFDTTQFDPATVKEMCWALVEAYLIDPWEDDPFNEEIKAYMGYMLDEEGYVDVPDILSMATRDRMADEITYGYTDDPEMFEAFYQKNADKTDDINKMIKRQLLELHDQLQSLKLRNGSPDGFLHQLKNKVK